MKSNTDRGHPRQTTISDDLDSKHQHGNQQDKAEKLYLQPTAKRRTTPVPKHASSRKTNARKYPASDTAIYRLSCTTFCLWLAQKCRATQPTENAACPPALPPTPTPTSPARYTLDGARKSRKLGPTPDQRIHTPLNSKLMDGPGRSSTKNERRIKTDWMSIYSV